MTVPIPQELLDCHHSSAESLAPGDTIGQQVLPIAPPRRDLHIRDARTRHH
jgi:hypothetical protein